MVKLEYTSSSESSEEKKKTQYNITNYKYIYYILNFYAFSVCGFMLWFDPRQVHISTNTRWMENKTLHITHRGEVKISRMYAAYLKRHMMTLLLPNLTLVILGGQPVINNKSISVSQKKQCMF